MTLIDEMCDALAAGDGATAYSTIDRVAEAGHDARRFASDLLERFRDLIVLQQVPDAVSKGLIDGPTDQLDAMTAQATRLGPATLSRCADIVHNGLVEMRGTTAPRLLLELITARMLLPGADDTTGALLQRLERMERRLTLTADHPQDSVRAQQPTPTPTDHGAAPPQPGSRERGPGRRPPGRRQSAAVPRLLPPVDAPTGVSAPVAEPDSRPRRQAVSPRTAHVPTGAAMRDGASSDDGGLCFRRGVGRRSARCCQPGGRRRWRLDAGSGVASGRRGGSSSPRRPTGQAPESGRDHAGRPGPRRPAMPARPGN